MYKLLIMVLLSSCSTQKEASLQKLFTKNYQHLPKNIVSFIEQEMEDAAITGLSIAIVDDQKIRWSRGFGFANIEDQVKATNKTIYRSGSISKVFTAMAIMQLAEQKKLDINQPLVTYLPEFSIKSRFGSTDNITLKNIMTHHSGLPRDYIDGLAYDPSYPFTSVVNRITHTSVTYPANQLFSYSNLGYTLAGHTVQRVSHQQYADYMQDKLLTPLKMMNSTFTGQPSGILMSKSYHDNELIMEPILRDIPAGGLNTNVIDLSNFLKMIHSEGQFQGKQILKKETFQLMTSRQNSNIELDLGKHIGLSWFFLDDYLGKKHQVIGHDGQTLAHSAVIATALNLKIGLVILANSIGHNDSLNTLAKKIMRLFLYIKTGENFKNSSSLLLPKRDKPFANFSGYYTTEVGLIKITGSPENYEVDIMGSTLVLDPDEQHLYTPKYKLFGLIPISYDKPDNLKIFPRTINQHELLISSEDGRQFIIAERIRPTERKKKWDNRLGKYEAINPSKIDSLRVESFELKRVEGFYTVEIKRTTGEQINYPLLPINDNEIVILGIGQGMGETIVIRKIKGKDIIKYSGLLFTKNGSI